MKFKAKKSRGWVAWTGESREDIPSIVGNPIKCLGKWFNESFTDKESIEDTTKMPYFGYAQLMAVNYLESTMHGSTCMGSYQDLCGCSSNMKLQLLQSKP